MCNILVIGSHMNISPVGYSYQNVNNIHKSQSFKGLWGEKSESHEFDGTLGIPKSIYTYYYYPCVDETEPLIRSEISSHTDADIKNIDGVDKYIVRECKRCATLPFSNVQLYSYQRLNKDSNIGAGLLKVHEYSQNKFKNSGKDDVQESAVNMEIQRRYPM